MTTRAKLPRIARRQWPYLCGILALPVAALFILAATLLIPGYSHITDTISRLGGREHPYPWVANTGMFLGGLLLLGFAYGLALQFGSSRGGKLLSALLGVNAAALIFAVIFETVWGEAKLEAAILARSVHELAARAGFTALIMAMLVLPAVVWRRPGWRVMVWVLLTLAVLAVVSGLLFVLQTTPNYSGVVQRWFFAACGLWVTLVALQLIRTTY